MNEQNYWLYNNDAPGSKAGGINYLIYGSMQCAIRSESKYCQDAWNA